MYMCLLRSRRRGSKDQERKKISASTTGMPLGDITGNLAVDIGPSDKRLQVFHFYHFRAVGALHRLSIPSTPLFKRALICSSVRSTGITTAPSLNLPVTGQGYISCNSASLLKSDCNLQKNSVRAESKYIL